jgi:hypothetical protein
LDLGCQSPKENKEVFYFMAEEIFKPIHGYEGHYEVSNMGNVRSVKFKKEKLLKKSLNTSGYQQVGLHKKGNIKTLQVHQLVAIVFLHHTPCGHNLVIDHINDIKTDNRVENLQIITNRENIFKTQGKYSSQYKGVHWHKTKKKWQSAFDLNKKRYYLGCFDNEYDAHLAYQNAIATMVKQ